MFAKKHANYKTNTNFFDNPFSLAGDVEYLEIN